MDGLDFDVSAWLKLDAHYDVIGVLTDPVGRVQLHILTDDDQSLAWFDSTHFRVIDGSLSRSWRARIHNDGALELAPSAWLDDGFWERYYDGDRSAIGAVQNQLKLMLGDE